VKNVISRTAIVLPLVLFCLAPCLSNAGFVDDWITQKTETDAGYFEGQKRGYYTGGSFSARWPVQNDYPVTFEPPRLKFGCGGIDAFMGGFSFLNFEYLVQKLQRIMTAAPAAAFDMALNTLCPQCSNTIKSLEEIANALNSIQLNDCQAGKTIAAKILSGVSTDPSIKAEADKGYNILKGLQDLPHKVSEIWTSTNNQPITPTASMIAECPSELLSLADPTKSILQIAAEGSNLTSDTIAMLRGMFGDAIYTVTNGDGNWKSIPPCEQNDLSSLNQLYTGNVYKRTDPNGECSLITDEKRNIFQWAGAMVEGIANKIEAKGALTAGEEEFIRHLPAPVYSTLKTAIVTNQLGSAYTELKDISARGYAYQIFSDITSRVAGLFRRVKVIVDRQGGKELSGCKPDLLTVAADAFSQRGMEYMFRYAALLKSDYSRALSENVTIKEMGRFHENFEKIAYRKLSGAFSPGVARKALGK